MLGHSNIKRLENWEKWEKGIASEIEEKPGGCSVLKAKHKKF